MDNQGKFVLIVGEAGIGKTRMLEEFMDIAENEDFRYQYFEPRNISVYFSICNFALRNLRTCLSSHMKLRPKPPVGQSVTLAGEIVW